MSKYAIETKGLTKSYKDLQVLKGIDLKIEKGKVFALLGPNGAGKTTIVKILSTLISPDSGEVTVDGIDVITDPQKVRGVIGLTGQYAAVDEYLNATENLEMMGRLYHLSTADSKRRAKELLEQFDLVEAANRLVKTYSGGMRRRLDLALSLIATPPIIFLDEPTTGLDPRSRIAVWEVVEQLARTGTTILLTTQYLEEADQLADRIAVIDGGKVIAEGTADELKQKVGKERLELTFNTNEEFDKAVGIIKGEAIQTNKSKKSVSLATDGSVSALREVLTTLEKAKIDVDTLSLHKPTLDDVFLNLTGHAAEETTDEEAAADTASTGKEQQ